MGRRAAPAPVHGDVPAARRAGRPLADRIGALSGGLHRSVPCSAELQEFGVQKDGPVAELQNVGVQERKDGDGFRPCVKEGDQVKKGQKVMDFDIEKIKAAGYADTVVFLVNNSDDFEDMTFAGE